MEIAIILLKILLLAWTITRFEPIEWVYESLPDSIRNNIISLVIIQMLTCFKCAALWIGLILTGSIWFALIASLIAVIYETSKISDWEKTKFN